MTNTTINRINVHELKKCLDTNSKLCLIDVRELNEWQSGHIAGAIHIPKNELPKRIAEISLDLNHPIYLHCLGGVRSLDAAQHLQTLGYKQLYSIDGGMHEWRMAGYPVEN